MAAVAADAALQSAVWQLHSRLAQLTHFSATTASGGPLSRLTEHTKAAQLVSMLSDCACLALQHCVQLKEAGDCCYAR